MSSKINVPNKRAEPRSENIVAKMAPIAGAVIGTIINPGLGTLAGYGAGKSVESMIYGFTPDDSKAEKYIPSVQQEKDSAISRRLEANREDRLVTLQRAEAALKTAPPEIREEYAPAIVQASIYEEQQRAMGRKV